MISFMLISYFNQHPNKSYSFASVVNHSIQPKSSNFFAMSPTLFIFLPI